MKDELLKLAAAMAEEQEINANIKLIREHFEEHHKPLFEKQAEIREKIRDYKRDITVSSVAGYGKDGEKKRLGGIGIRLGTVLVYDESLAFGWAKDHSLCLQLDKKEFEKIVKTQNIDFVDRKEKITVTFPKEINLEE